MTLLLLMGFTVLIFVIFVTALAYSEGYGSHKVSIGKIFEDEEEDKDEVEYEEE